MALSFLLALALLSGCAHQSTLTDLLTHKASPDQPFCQSVAPVGPSQLQTALEPYAASMGEGKTGVYALEDGAGALVARAWLTDNAAKTIDAQYFIFSADNVGLIATERLLLAAERGVKVRLIVDDVLAHGDAEILLAVNAHPNLEVRVYNPNVNIGKGLSDIINAVVTDFRGVNQRMHNKTFIVDQTMAITGGRNVGAEYYDFHEQYNFRDRDLLLMGGATSQLQSSFNTFWADTLSVPLERVLVPEDPAKPEVVWRKMHQYACDPERFLPSFRQRIEQAPQTFQTLAADGKLKWVNDVRYVSDPPGKNNERTSLGGGGTTTTALIELVNSAQKTLFMETPYLIVTDLGLGLLRDAVKRGVDVRILTNSIVSTDGLAAFAGYQSVRDDVLDTGVKLYEFRPDANIRHELMTGPKYPKAAYGLHAKTMVVDGETLMVGTFNLDPRSANLNTEGVTIVRDADLARLTGQQLQRDMLPENAWRTTKAQNPDSQAGWWRRFKVCLQRMIPNSIL